jgi:Ca-activated chloride channel family protein
MINFKGINDKEVVKTGFQKKKVLFKIKGEKEQQIAKGRMPLNISLVFDVSGSMADSIGKKLVNVNPNNDAIAFLKGIDANNQRNVGFIGGLLENNFNTKLSQVKEAGMKCIEMLEDGDFVSIVTFNGNASVVQEAIKINDGVRQQLKNKILFINAGGGTNLHDGWLQGGMEVAKNLSSKSINRVLVLTDGETNQGITDSNEISKHVEGLARKGISTSTFGVGDHYNEDLLEKMATVSGGNSYYIEDENKVVSILKEEFTCLNNIVGDNATIEFITNSGASITCLNELDYAEKKYMIGNLIGGREVNILMEFSFTNTNAVSYDFNLGDMKLGFTNNEGKKEYLVIPLVYKTVSEEDLNSLKMNEEVNIQDVILEMAKQQKLAKEAVKNGDRVASMKFMRTSIKSSESFSSDPRVKKEIDALNTFIAESESYSDVKMGKMLSSMSYDTRTSKKG